MMSVNKSNTNNWIEESISKKYINKFEYTDFKNIQPIGGGNFGKVIRANWRNTDTLLALKSFDNNKLTLKEIVNEIKLQKSVDFHPNILRFYGITKGESGKICFNSDLYHVCSKDMIYNSCSIMCSIIVTTLRKHEGIQQMNYLLVLEYADGGTLNRYLSTHFNELDWYDKYQLAFQLASAVECIHECGIIHRDLHANNVLIHNKQIKLADFGLSRRTAEVSNNVFGVIPYIDPESFNTRNYKLNEKSDIYSIGVLLWQISSGREPFCTEVYDIRLALSILEGKREEIVDDTPIKYSNLYKECWRFEESKRPEIKQVVSALKEIIFPINNNEKEEIYLNVEKVNNLELSKTSNINSTTNLNEDLLLENISNIINSKSNNNNNSPSHNQGSLLNEEKAQSKYFCSYETTEVNEKEEYKVTQINSDDSYKNCGSIYNECKEVSHLSNKTVLKPNKKLAGKECLDATFNLRFYMIILAILVRCNRFEDVIRFLSGYQKIYSVFKNKIFLEKLKESYLTVEDKTSLELRKKFIPKSNNNSILHNHDSAYFNLMNILLEESTQFEYCYNNKVISEKEEYNMTQNIPDNLYKNCRYMEYEFIEVSKLFNKGVKYRDKNYFIETFKLCKKLADKEYLDAQFQLGYYYENGIGTEISKKKAFKLYKIAAKKNHGVAQNNLGNLYENGEGVKKDFNEAFYWFKKAAENGNEVAIYNLGECYELGIGVDKNLVKAFEFYKVSAEKGDLDAMFQLGYFYINGFGTKIRKKKGFELYNKAIDKDKKFNILSQYKNDDKITNDIEKVNYWYRKAAEDDNKVALYKLGEFYELGKGVCKNKVRAFTFYKQAAEKGYTKARYKLGYCYENGIGTHIDLEKAGLSYKVAEKEGNINIQEKLNIYCQQSKGNLEIAFNWYRKAKNVMSMIW